MYIKGDVPLTIYGDSANPGNVHIMSTLSALASASDYQSIANPNNQRYQEGDPAWDLYNSCANKNESIGTECSAVFWVQSAELQLLGVTIHNGATDAQAIAIKTSADKVGLIKLIPHK